MFDAIVVGSGISGGWVAKELTEKGLKVLLLERGPNIEHITDYKDGLMPWEQENEGRVPEDEAARDYAIQSTVYPFSSANKTFWVNDREHPYSTAEGKPFTWIRGFHLGGRSLMWGRMSLRLSDLDFSANKKDGHGSDWPIRYADLKPWYDHVEAFAGVSGSTEGLAQLPDGDFLKPMGLNDVEADFKKKIEARFPGRTVIPPRVANLSEAREQHTDLGRSPCQYRSQCHNGCSYGAYFSSLSATLPAAQKTGNLTVVTDAIVDSVIHDPKSNRVTGVRVIDGKTKQGKTYDARMVFLNASTIPTAQILLGSKSAAFPNGLANSSDMVGRNLMDHLGGAFAMGVYPGFEDRYYRGRRPQANIIPRYRNVDTQEDYLRSFGMVAMAFRSNWKFASMAPIGVGAAAKQRMRGPGPWMLFAGGGAEMLPNRDNRVTLHPTRKDQWGMAIPHIECAPGDNDRKVVAAAQADAEAMLTAAGAHIIAKGQGPGSPGVTIHEMGTAHMGTDPRTSVLNKYNQAHDVPNLFITDGSAMASSATQNPSLTYMALSARAAHHAVEFLKAGKI
ncbi:GMC family oxidoreductase [Novosphingobium sp. G106]|uniref:GMC oxidoreductase n=1 Tax=Novosphingobium sp. G106 TaxID=2849500 RepID=UPI001C2DEDF8|nr:GMC family oxidoreductase [Novosphingobium sp. G106]MBV1687832.1 GMC family oxidoreductase [Novosphingobium sp. G106]